MPFWWLSLACLAMCLCPHSCITQTVFILDTLSCCCWASRLRLTTWCAVPRLLNVNIIFLTYLHLCISSQLLLRAGLSLRYSSATLFFSLGNAMPLSRTRGLPHVAGTTAPYPVALTTFLRLCLCIYYGSDSLLKTSQNDCWIELIIWSTF